MAGGNVPLGHACGHGIGTAPLGPLSWERRSSIEDRTLPGTGEGRGLLRDWIAREMHVVRDSSEEAEEAYGVEEINDAAKFSDQKYM